MTTSTYGGLMKPKSLHMGFEIQFKSGSLFKPQSLVLWDQSSRFSDFPPEKPYKYMNDALVGLSFHRLTDYCHLTPPEKIFAEKSFHEIDPYSQLYKSAHHRVKSFAQEKKKPCPAITANFENKFSEFLSSCIEPQKIQFSFMNQGLELIKNFENELGSPLIYHYSLEFSEKFNEKLLAFQTLLYHLRTIVALQFNSKNEDSVFENVRCDSITDYLPKADFTVNDALMFWQFKKLSIPFIGHKNKDIALEKLFIEPLERSFYQYNHNACALIDQLPEGLLSSHSLTELEDFLHQSQMDWLLGTSSGILFRLREELFGLCHGYDQVFWPDLLVQEQKMKSTTLKVSFELTESEIFNPRVAA